MSFEYDQNRGMQGRNETGGNIVEEQFLVPDKMVGKIIGLCGEQIHRLEMETGCKIQLDSKNNEIPYRICTLTGSLKSVKAAKSMIEQIISEYSNDSFQYGHVPDGQFVTEIMIPGLKVALLIGKGGENIKNLQEQCGVKMAIIQDGPEQSIYDKPLRIWGDKQNVKVAKQMVKDFLAQNETVSVPIDKCGLVIGKGGKTLRNINQQSGAHVDKARELPSYSNEQTFIIRGNPKQIEHAKNLIMESVSSPIDKCGLVIGKGGKTLRNIIQQSGAHVDRAREFPSYSNEQTFIIRGNPKQSVHANHLIRESVNSGQGDSNFFWAIFWLIVVVFLWSYISKS